MAKKARRPWPADEVERREVASLVPYARNARTHSEAQVRELMASIQQWGWTVPVLVDEDDTIIAGHGRVLAAEGLGLEDVPVMVARGWTDEERRAYVIADNRLAENAEWDRDLLRSELTELGDAGFDLGLVGFDLDALASLLPDRTGGLSDPDDVPELDKGWSVAGDVWILGAHRVACGDATKDADLDLLMGGQLANVCWTDPPYNVDYDGKAGQGRIQNDQMDDAAFRSFLETAFACTRAVMRQGAAIYVAHADGVPSEAFRAAFRLAGFKFSACLIWQKSNFTLGRSDYQWQHEPILYGWNPGARHRWFGGRSQSTTFEPGEGSIFTENEDGSLTVVVGSEAVIVRGKGLKAEPLEGTVIRCEKPRSSKEHPTMKPVELISRMLRNSSKVGDLVLDPFGGSGSTLIASEMLGRVARILELDPRFVDVIVRRWQEFTGQAATLEQDGRTFEEVLNDRQKPRARKARSRK